MKVSEIKSLQEATFKYPEKETNELKERDVYSFIWFAWPKCSYTCPFSYVTAIIIYFSPFLLFTSILYCIA